MSTSSRSLIPGPKSRQWANRLRRVESRNVTYQSNQFPVFWASAQGAWVKDVDGQRFLDLTSAFAVASLGHSPQILRQAIRKQSQAMWHGMGDIHPNAIKVLLLESLAELAPGALSVSILSNSGAEAVESALKTARLATGRPGILVFEGGYHGLTYGTLGATDRKEFTAPFADQLARHFVHAPFPDSLRGPTEDFCLEFVEGFFRKGGKTPAGLVGALLIEPIQGRGGVRIPPPSFLNGLRQIAQRYGVLFIADEIFTGFGRTGRDFAVDHSGVSPDLMCLGKALTNGFPLSVCVVTPAVMRAWPASDGEAIHTSTFLGNPLGCAMALASLSEFQKKRLSRRAADLGLWWKNELLTALGDHPCVGEIRSAGLMLGIELVKDKRGLIPDRMLASQIVTQALQNHLILLSGGIHRNVITLTPPLTISKQELTRGTEILKKIFYGKTRTKN